MRSIKRLCMPAAVLAAGISMVMASQASASSMYVTEANVVTGNPTTNDAHWYTEDTRPGGSMAFTNDFGAPSGFGSGALQLATTDSSAKVQLLTPQDAGQPLSGISSVGYNTYRSSSSTGSAVQVPSIQLQIDTNGSAAGGFTTLVFEPVYNTDQGPILDDSWQAWNAAGTATWWSSRDIPGTCAFSCYASFDQIKANNPDAVILQYGVDLGSGNPGITAAVDGLTVGAKTFDFERLSSIDKAECKSGGWSSSFAPGMFKNQGDCVSYFASGGKTHPAG